jgi:isoleucyl-tRNA synthetase
MPPPLELKKTLNLPKTDFSMKANLPQNEPKWLERWEKMGIYAKIRESRRGAPSYVLHDGPPYANGAIHEGHALNKCLKDFVMFHPDLEYVALEHKCEFYIVAEALAAATVNSCSLTDAWTVARFPGRQLEYATFAHPFLDRLILRVLAKYVTMEQGAGAVSRLRRERERAFARI